MLTLPPDVADAVRPLPDGYAAVLRSLCEELRSSGIVRAVYVSGSVAAADADRHSDLDLQCVVDSGGSPAAAAVASAVWSTITVVDHRWVVPDMILSVVDDQWRRVDVTIIDHGAGRTVAHDALAVFDDIGATRGTPPTFRLDPSMLTAQISRFLRSIGLVVRDLERGDLRQGCWATEFLIDELVTLLYQANGLQRGAHKGAIAHLPPDDAAVVLALPVARPERGSIIDAHVALADVYLTRAAALCEACGADWPAPMELATRNHLRRELGIELAPLRTIP